MMPHAGTQLVCVVPQQSAGRTGGSRTPSEPTRREIVRQRVSGSQRLRGDLAFAVSDRVRFWLVASDEVQSAITAHCAWVANELLAREIVFGEPPVDHQAKHEGDPNGSGVRSAITKEP